LEAVKEDVSEEPIVSLPLIEEVLDESHSLEYISMHVPAGAARGFTERLDGEMAHLGCRSSASASSCAVSSSAAVDSTVAVSSPPPSSSCSGCVGGSSGRGRGGSEERGGSSKKRKRGRGELEGGGKSCRGGKVQRVGDGEGACVVDDVGSDEGKYWVLRGPNRGASSHFGVCVMRHRSHNKSPFHCHRMFGRMKFNSYHSSEEAAARESDRLAVEHWSGKETLRLNFVPNEDLKKLIEERVKELRCVVGSTRGKHWVLCGPSGGSSSYFGVSIINPKYQLKRSFRVTRRFDGAKFWSCHSTEESAARESDRLSVEHWCGRGHVGLNLVPNEDLEKLIEERVGGSVRAGAGASAGAL
jgi:hypothetical protein